MADNEESYADFVKRYRADKGEPAEGPRISSVNKHLALTIAAGFAFYLFTSWVSRDLDEAVANEHVARMKEAQGAFNQEVGGGRNPWSKD